MDYTLIGLIIAACFGGYKLLKDVHDKKTTKTWLIVVETTLIVSALFVGIYGRLNQKDKEANIRESLNQHVDNVSTHGDSSISRAEQNIKEAENADFRRLQDTVENLRRENQAKQRVIDMDRKPQITIQPLPARENPQLKKTSPDSLKISILFENCGAATANSLHIRCTYLGCDSHENPAFLIKRVVADQNATSKILPICLQGGFEIINRMKYQVTPDSLVVACITYCYQDSLERKYGPFTEMFEWFKDSSEIGTYTVDRYGYERCKTYLTNIHLWENKIF